MLDCHKKPCETRSCALCILLSPIKDNLTLLNGHSTIFMADTAPMFTESWEDMQDIAELMGTYNSHVFKTYPAFLILGLYNIFSLPSFVNECRSGSRPALLSFVSQGGRKAASAEINSFFVTKLPY
jgi:hypothetical protein